MRDATVNSPATQAGLPAARRVDPSTLALAVLLLLVSLVPIAAALHHPSSLNDDTYITLTYARSLAEGEGWRYNGGAEAIGTTTPLFALLLAGLKRLLPVLSLESLAVAASTLSWLSSGWLLFLGHRHFGISRLGGMLAAVAILVQENLWISALGMETSTLMLGLLLAVRLAAGGHALAAGLLSTTLFLVRPEGIAIAPLAGFWLILKDRERWRERALRFAAGATLPLLLWGAYTLPRFGAVLSNSATTKMGLDWERVLFVERFFREWLPAFASNYGLSPGLSLLWPLLLLGLLYGARGRRPILLLAAWLVVFLVGYWVVEAPTYWWYMLPALFVLRIFAALGVVALVEHPRATVRGAGILLALGFFLLNARATYTAFSTDLSDPRADTYRGVATWLRSHAPPGSTVAFMEIGYLGYFTDLHVIDLVGLTAPEYAQNAKELDFAENFWQAEPDYFLYTPPFDWSLGAIVADPRFDERYRVVAELPSHWDAPLLLYARKD